MTQEKRKWLLGSKGKALPPEERLLQQLVAKVSKLEKELSRVRTMQSVIGNARCLGGKHGDGPGVVVDHSSGAYQDFGGSQYTGRDYVKKYEETDLLFLFGLRAFQITATSSVYNLGIQVAGTDYGSRQWTITPINEFETAAEMVAAGGVPAGTFNAEIRIMRASGTGALRFNSASSYWIVVFEVPGGLTFT